MAFALVKRSYSHRSIGEYYINNDMARSMSGLKVFRAVRPDIPAAERQPIRRTFSNKVDEQPEFPPELRQHVWRFG